MPFGSDRTGWSWEQHLNCPNMFKPTSPRQGPGIWPLYCAFCHVLVPILSLLGYCKLAIVNLFVLCFIKVVSRQTTECSNIFKCHCFPLNWFGGAVSLSSRSISGQDRLQALFLHAYWGVSAEPATNKSNVLISPHPKEGNFSLASFIVEGRKGWENSI